MDDKKKTENYGTDGRVNGERTAPDTENTGAVSANSLLGKLRANLDGASAQSGSGASDEKSGLFFGAAPNVSSAEDPGAETVGGAASEKDAHAAQIGGDGSADAARESDDLAEIAELFRGVTSASVPAEPAQAEESEEAPEASASDATEKLSDGASGAENTVAERADAVPEAPAASENVREAAPAAASAEDDFDSDDGVDDTDVQLMVAFGMEDELAETLGFEKAAELSETAELNAKVFLPRRREKRKNDEPEEAFEFTSPEQVKPIINAYKSRYRMLLVRIAICFLLLIFSFLFENLPAFGANLPNWMNSATYPVVYSMFGLQLLVLAAALVPYSLRDGFIGISRREMTPQSGLSIVVAFSALYNIVMCFMHMYSVPSAIRLFNFPVIIMIFMMLIGEYMDLKREIFSFNVVASKKNKFVIESLSERQETLETAAFSDFLPEESSIFRISETSFVDGFYSRMRTAVTAQKTLNILFPLVFAAAVIFLIWDALVDHSAELAITAAQYTLNIVMPFAAALSFSYPFYAASKAAYKEGSAIIGGVSLEEYCASSSAITFEDKDVFPAHGVVVRSIKTYGESPIDYIIYNAASLFMKVGGPLAEVFETATRELEHSSDVQLTSVVSGGLEAYVDGAHVYCGSSEYLAENGIEAPYDPEDEALLNEGSITIMHLVIGGEVVAKLYIQYLLDKDFENTLRQLAKLGICVGIKTFDPNITDVMLNRKIRMDEYPIKILRCRTMDDASASSENVDSGVVSKRSVKAMMHTYSLCEKVLHAMKTGVMLNVLSMVFALLIVAFVLLIKAGSSFVSWHVALYQLIWLVPTVLITKLYVGKN